jgi:hypothetical protein
MVCFFKNRCWNYSLLACLIKKDNCDLIPYLKDLGNDLYNECQIDAHMQVEGEELATAKRIMRMYKVDLVSKYQFEDYK